jgi:hypothetical protein
MRIYIAADGKPLTACTTRMLHNIVNHGRWAASVTQPNGATEAEMTEQCAVILLARERGLLPETV